MKQIDLLNIGADVELFVMDRKTKEVISAEGFIKGTKRKPFVFDELQPDFATSLDNVLAEYGIPPATNKVEFYNYLQKGMSFLNQTLPQDLCVAPLPAAILDEKYLHTRQAKTFGCEPDFNAYTLNMNPRPTSTNLHLRSAGGHVHVAYNSPIAIDPDTYMGDEERATIVRALDLFIGVPSVILEPDNQRKELYGKAGAYRPKSYGLEYRTVSNFYLESKRLTYWVYEAVERAIAWVNSLGVMAEEKIKDLTKDVQNVVNNNMKSSALRLIEEFNLITDKRLKLAIAA